MAKVNTALSSSTNGRSRGYNNMLNSIQQYKLVQ
jgi:hypothetical protein